MSGINGYPQGFNLYAYCFNNPVNLTDGEGNWPEWIKNAAKWTVEKVVKPVVDFIENELSKLDATVTNE